MPPTSAALSIDARALGLARALVALAALTELAARSQRFVLLHTTEGLLPPAALLASPPDPSALSPLHALHGVVLPWGWLLGTVAALGLLLVGWRTRGAALTAFVGLLGLHASNPLVELPRDAALHLAVLLCALVPAGAGLSVDAVWQSFSLRVERDADELEERTRLPRAETAGGALHGLAVRGLIAATLAAGGLALLGPAWRDGLALRVLAAAGPLGAWLPPGAAAAATGLLGFASLLIGGAALLPARRLQSFSALGLVALALSLLGMAQGPAPALLALAAAIAVFPAAQARPLARRAFDAPPLTLFFDAACGICFQSARLLARIDPLHAIRFVPSYETARLPPGVDPAVVEHTIVAVDDRGALTYRAAAFAAVFARLPGLAPLGWLLRAPGVRTLARFAYEAFAARRRDVSVWLGLAACGLRPPVAAGATRDAPLPPAPSPALALALAGLVAIAGPVAALAPAAGALPGLSTLAGLLRVRAAFDALAAPPRSFTSLRIPATTASGAEVDALRPDDGPAITPSSLDPRRDDRRLVALARALDGAPPSGWIDAMRRRLRSG